MTEGGRADHVSRVPLRPRAYTAPAEPRATDPTRDAIELRARVASVNRGAARAAVLGSRRQELEVRNSRLHERQTFLEPRLRRAGQRREAATAARAAPAERRVAVERSLAGLAADLAASGGDCSPMQVAEGLRRVADGHMAAAIRAGSLRRGHDVEPGVAEAAELPLLPEGVNPAARVRDLERELRLMGPINPLALEEFNELQERHTFLEAQLEDVRETRRELLRVIKAIDAETRGGYGWPRTWKELLARGIRVGKDRVQKLMQLHGIRARGKRRFKVTTDSKHDLPIAANLLNQAFAVSEPDKVWVGDITYIATDEGWLFLAVVIDLFSRQVVGWSLRQDMTRELVIDALRMAWFKRHPGKDAGLIFHSDRGSQYASKDYRDVLTEYGITASMSRRGNCWDNACSETLFGSLKVERLHGQRFKSRRQAKDEVVAWLLWYNRTRLHSTLAYTSPMQFEEAWLASQPRQASA